MCKLTFISFLRTKTTLHCLHYCTIAVYIGIRWKKKTALCFFCALFNNKSKCTSSPLNNMDYTFTSPSAFSGFRIGTLLQPKALFASFVVRAFVNMTCGYLLVRAEEKLKDSSYKIMIQRLYRTLMDLVLTSFILEIFKIVGLNPSEDWVFAYDFADLCVFTMAIFFSIQGVIVIIFSIRDCYAWARAENIRSYDLIIDVDANQNSRPYYWRWRYLPYFATRDQVEFRMFHAIFSLTYNIGGKDQSFDFSDYLKQTHEANLLELMDFDMVKWTIIIVYAGIIALCEQFIHLKCDNLHCESRLQMLFFTCGGCGILLFCLFIYLNYRQTELRLLNHFGVHDSSDYEIFMMKEDTIKEISNKRMVDTKTIFSVISNLKHERALNRMKASKFITYVAIEDEVVGGSERRKISNAGLLLRNISGKVMLGVTMMTPTKSRTTTVVPERTKKKRKSSILEASDSWDDYYGTAPPMDEITTHTVEEKTNTRQALDLNLPYEKKELKTALKQKLSKGHLEGDEESKNSSHVHFKEVYWMKDPIYLLACINIAITAICLYLGLWITTYVFVAQEVGNLCERIVWIILPVVPLLIMFPILSLAIKSSTLLKALSELNVNRLESTLKRSEMVKRYLQHLRHIFIRQLTKHAGVGNERKGLNDAFEEIDQKNQGYLDFEDFCHVLLNLQIFVESSMAESMFTYVDLDLSYTISIEVI